MSDDFASGWRALKTGDYETALRIWKPLAEQGNAGAQAVLGGMYHKGNGVPQDKTEAVKWWKCASKKENKYAQFSLGLMYANGDGVRQDFVEAYRCWERAGKQGHEAAMKGADSLWRMQSVQEQRYQEMREAKAEAEFEVSKWFDEGMPDSSDDKNYCLDEDIPNYEEYWEEFYECLDWDAVVRNYEGG